MRLLNKLLLTISVICFVASCNKSPLMVSYQPSEKAHTAALVKKKAAIQLQKELELQPIGTGGQMMNEIRMLALSFEYDKPIDACKGRRLLLTAVDTFLSVINADENIRPYLYRYPFTPKNVEIRIFIKNHDRSQVPIGQLCILSSIEGTIEYDIHDPTTTHLVTAYEETYQEALDKLAVNSTEPQQLLPPPAKPPRQEDGRTQISICL